VNLSIHTAPASLLLEPLGLKPTQKVEQILSVFWLAAFKLHKAQNSDEKYENHMLSFS
jgi:hypothetical protein